MDPELAKQEFRGMILPLNNAITDSKDRMTRTFRKGMKKGSHQNLTSAFFASSCSCLIWAASSSAVWAVIVVISWWSKGSAGEKEEVAAAGKNPRADPRWEMEIDLSLIYSGRIRMTPQQFQKLQIHTWQ
jgi:hypothetical protein